MEMPTNCLNCGIIFDLNDGYESNKWYHNTIICANCKCKENLEIDKDEKIEDFSPEFLEKYRQDPLFNVIWHLKKNGVPIIDILEKMFELYKTKKSKLFGVNLGSVYPQSEHNDTDKLKSFNNSVLGIPWEPKNITKLSKKK